MATHVKRVKVEHIDRMRGWREMIDEKLAEVATLERQLVRARRDAELLQEAFTAWLAATYHIHPERGEQWRLDIEHVQLVHLNALGNDLLPNDEVVVPAERSEVEVEDAEDTDAVEEAS